MIAQVGDRIVVEETRPARAGLILPGPESSVEQPTEPA